MYGRGIGPPENSERVFGRGSRNLDMQELKTKEVWRGHNESNEEVSKRHLAEVSQEVMQRMLGDFE